MSEPLGQSQVLPYLRGLGRDHGWRFRVVGFEPWEVSDARLRSLTDELRGDGIAYSWSRRSRSHTLPTKFAEAGGALARVIALGLRRPPDIIHARGYLPAAVGLALGAAFPRAKVIFDCRGLLADEYVDAGHWVAGSLPFRLVKATERVLFRRADAVVTLTERLRSWLRGHARLLPSATPTEVIPCCVDLARFRSSPRVRRESRESIGAGDKLVIAYSGSLGSWYREADMARLFAAIRRLAPAVLLLLTRSPPGLLLDELARAGVPATDVRLRVVEPADMPALLSAADAGISLIRSCFSKIASSPTKIAEYLAMGLPVVMNTDIGDGARLVGLSDAVVDVGSSSTSECERAASEIVRVIATAGIAERARRLAEELFSVETIGVVRYARLYARLGRPEERTSPSGRPSRRRREWSGASCAGDAARPPP